MGVRALLSSHAEWLPIDLHGTIDWVLVDFLQFAEDQPLLLILVQGYI